MIDTIVLFMVLSFLVPFSQDKYLDKQPILISTDFQRASDFLDLSGIVPIDLRALMAINLDGQSVPTFVVAQSNFLQRKLTMEWRLQKYKLAGTVARRTVTTPLEV